MKFQIKICISLLEKNPLKEHIYEKASIIMAPDYSGVS